METQNGKNKKSEVGNGIKEERLKALKGNYQKPILEIFRISSDDLQIYHDMAGCGITDCMDSQCQCLNF